MIVNRVLAAILLASGICRAATFYVSGSGDDSNSGTGSSSAWRTLQHASSYACLPGDIILLQSGGVWHESMTVPCSGMTIGAYGIGAMPVITAALLAGPFISIGVNVWMAPRSWTPYSPNFNGTPGIPVASQAALTAPYDWYWDGAYLYVYNIGDPSAIVEIPSSVSALTVNGVQNVTLKGIALRGAIYCNIEIEGAASGFTASNISSTDAFWSGLKVFDNVPPPFPAINNGKITNSYFAFNGGSGIVIENSQQSGWQIVGNTVIYNCINPSYSFVDGQYNAGIHLYSGAGTGNALIQNNYVAWSGFGVPLVPVTTATQGVGIWADSTAGTQISGNVVHDNLNAGIMIEKNLRSTVSANISYNNGPIPGSSCKLSDYTCLGGQIYIRAGEGSSGADNIVSNNTAQGGQQGITCAVYPDGNNFLSNNRITNNKVSGASVANLWVGYGCDNDGLYGVNNVYANNVLVPPTIYWQ